MGVLVVVIVVVLALITTGGENDSSSTAAPATTLPFDSSTTAAPPTTTPMGTTTVVSTTVPPPPSTYEMSVPGGQCTAAAVTRDTGLTATWGPSCEGVWLITNATCVGSEEIECEGVDVMRWSAGAWQHRGAFYAMCETALTDSGMPLTIARNFVGYGDDFCAWERSVSPESATGSLEIGDQGERVRALQRALIARGLLDDEADAEFGPNTRSAVIDFQFLEGLTPDGIAGAATHAALGLPFG